MKFDSDYEPAKPSAVILEIIRRAIEENNLVINFDNVSHFNASTLFMVVNDSVRDDIDDFVQRYHENGGSTIPKEEQ